MSSVNADPGELGVPQSDAPLLLRVVLAGVLAGAVFVLLLGYRTDYAGHFLAGYGGTLALLAAALAKAPHLLGVSALWIALLAILLGAGVEATIFKLAIFDPVDFCNQSLGAVLAALAVVEQRGSFRAAGLLGVVSFVFLVVGALYAFA